MLRLGNMLEGNFRRRKRRHNESSGAQHTIRTGRSPAAQSPSLEKENRVNQEKKEDIVTRPTVRAEIDRMLAELVPERFVPPPVKRTADMRLVCMATEEIKRLHTLRERLANKHEALSQKYRELGRDFKERALLIGNSEGNKELKIPDSPLFVIKRDMWNLEAKLRRTDLLGNFVDMNLSLEIINQHVDLETKLFQICNDWSLCLVEENATKPLVITRVTLADEGAPKSPSRNHARRIH